MSIVICESRLGIVTYLVFFYLIMIDNLAVFHY